jgi:hypothetical protein
LAVRAAAKLRGVTMTATRRRTRSSANSGSRVATPSAKRYSTRNVAALDIAGFSQALAKCRHEVFNWLARVQMEEPNHRHRSLLRLRGKRPCCRAAEKRDELAPPKLSKLHPLPLAREAAYQIGEDQSGPVALRDFDPTYRRFGS